MAARLFAREDGTTSLIGFNLSNSADNEIVRQAAKIRKSLGLEQTVRFEHHITETQKLNRHSALSTGAMNLRRSGPGSFQHCRQTRGGDPEVDAAREHPERHTRLFLPKNEIISKGLTDALEQNYLDKHGALNRTADALIKAGIGVVCAWNLHR